MGKNRIALGSKSSRPESKNWGPAIYRAKSGIPWREVPERFGPWKSGYNRFNNWAKAGIWELLFATLSTELDGVDEEEGSIVDATIVRAHQDSAGGKEGSNATLWDALRANASKNQDY